MPDVPPEQVARALPVRAVAGFKLPVVQAYQVVLPGRDGQGLGLWDAGRLHALLPV